MTQVSLGRKVHYKLSADDVAAIDADFPMDAGGHRRNPVREGQLCAADVVAVFEASTDNTANLQVQLDGNVTYWATSRREGTEPGTWAWPLRG